MDYEKKYNEVLERAKKLSVDGYLDAIAVEDIFPELRESEDERIRKTLVEYFGPKVQLDFVRGVPIQKIRDWLEKQKEQKPAEWSEEDQLNLNWVIAILNGEPCDLDIQLESLIAWLKSLRPSWKPSED